MDTELFKVSEKTTLYADVILPVPIPRLYTYSIPLGFQKNASRGCRVIVQFGSRKVYTGIIAHIHEEAPKVYKTKDIIDLLDEVPSVTDEQLKLMAWMADYYMCTIGEVMNAAIPSGLKLHSESKIQLNPLYIPQPDHVFSISENLVIDTLEKKGSLSYSDLSVVAGTKNIHPILKSLIARQRILLFEEVKEKFNPKKIKWVRLNSLYVSSPEFMEELFAKLQKRPKQTEVLLNYLRQVPVMKDKETNKVGIEKGKLLSLSGAESSYRTLVKEGVFEEYEEVVSRFPEIGEEEGVQIKLSDNQLKARDEILENFQEKDIVLLHGITGSGKTEVFIDLILKALDSGSQVLYMLPEIALTTQIVTRLRKVFGGRMGIYHSRFSDNERVEVWQGVMSGRFSFIVGVRSSVFLPFDNLGLIIVDEEHETSYKQYDPSPRYHARDTALMLARLHHAKTLLGSATPSIESYYQCMSGQWGLVNLTGRYGNAPLPEIVLVDIKREKKFKTMRSDFSSVLLEEMASCIGGNEQAIIFQNRRGFAPYYTCEDCAYVIKCVNCDVSLTYHMYKNELRCHYCGNTETVPQHCDACGSTRLKTVGFGTEKIEQELGLLLPEAKIRRMDTDTTRAKNSYQQIVEDFESQKANVLVGTQMVSKGFDFSHVSLVGIVDADRMLHFPDFRSFERSFQMLVQVSGRAGRREKKGKVVIQTANPRQPVLQMVVNNDYLQLYKTEIEEREKFFYPPFVRLIKLTSRHTDRGMAEKAANALFKGLVSKLGKQRVLGPEWPVIDRIRNAYHMDVFIKLERGKISLSAAKDLIKTEIEKVVLDKKLKNVNIVVDVDPA